MRPSDGNDGVAQKLAYASTSYTPPNVRLPGEKCYLG